MNVCKAILMFLSCHAVLTACQQKATTQEEKSKDLLPSRTSAPISEAKGLINFVFSLNHNACNAIHFETAVPAKDLPRTMFGGFCPKTIQVGTKTANRIHTCDSFKDNKGTTYTNFIYDKVLDATGMVVDVTLDAAKASCEGMKNGVLSNQESEAPSPNGQSQSSEKKEEIKPEVKEAEKSAVEKLNLYLSGAKEVSKIKIYRYVMKEGSDPNFETYILADFSLMMREFKQPFGMPNSSGRPLVASDKPIVLAAIQKLQVEEVDVASCDKLDEKYAHPGRKMELILDGKAETIYQLGPNTCKPGKNIWFVSPGVHRLVGETFSGHLGISE